MYEAKKLDFSSYFLGLPSPERDAFAEAAGTNAVYIRDHLLAGRRMPRNRLLDGLKLALEQRGHTVERADLVSYFYSLHQSAACR